MRAYVFTDRSLERHAGRFVWLEIDTEKPENAKVLEKLPVVALPTYFVVDPAAEKAVVRWVGGASVAQMDRLLDEASATIATRYQSTHAADQALGRADRLYGEGREAQAAEAYEEALRAAPKGWPSYARALESLLFAYQVADRPESCLARAAEAYPRLKGTASAANVAASGLSCALDLPKEHPKRAAQVAAFEGFVREVLADSSVGASADEISGVYIALHAARSDAGNVSGAKEVARAWAAHLEQAAARAAGAEQRTVYDSHRLSAYLELGEPERAIPMLEHSARDFPSDYNPDARLAVAYQALKKWDQAIAASSRALAKSYGPRKLRIFLTDADIRAAAGDTVAAVATLEEGLRYAGTLPEKQRSKTRVAALEKRLESLR